MHINMQSEQAISPCNFARSQPESLLLNRKAGSRGAAPEKFFRCMLTIPRSHPNNPPNPKRQPTWLCKTTRCQRLYVRCNSMYVMYSEPAEREGMADMILAMLRWLFILVLKLDQNWTLPFPIFFQFFSNFAKFFQFFPNFFSIFFQFFFNFFLIF